jgi:uncharacterized protein (TIGR02145 family)
MKRVVLLISALLLCIISSAQTYIISFTGIGESTTVSSVEVENLTSGATASITNSGQTLTLTPTTGVDFIDNKQSKELKIYPNPMTDNSIMQVNPPAAGDAIITVSDMTGKKIAQVQSYLNSNLQEFCLSGINRGLYVVSVKGSTYQYSGKLLSNAKTNRKANIEKVSNNAKAGYEKTMKQDSKSFPSTINMEYTTGDRLIFIGTSGNYSTVVTDIPTETKTVIFNFISCTDYDGNNYSVVEIGTKVWMAENLKTTSYKQGGSITLVTNTTLWSNSLTGAYCWYGNDEATYKDIYGALYNWYTLGNGNLCPTGWSIPTDTDWTTLTDYLGGEAVAGGKLKETGLSHWISNTGATNEAGFTGLPGNYRSWDGSFSTSGGYCFWWASTMGGDGPWYRMLVGFSTSVDRDEYNQKAGFSVRCLKD